MDSSPRPTSPGVSLFGKPVIRRAVNLPSLASFVIPETKRTFSPPRPEPLARQGPRTQPGSQSKVGLPINNPTAYVTGAGLADSADGETRVAFAILRPRQEEVSRSVPVPRSSSRTVQSSVTLFMSQCDSAGGASPSGSHEATSTATTTTAQAAEESDAEWDSAESTLGEDDLPETLTQQEKDQGEKVEGRPGQGRQPVDTASESSEEVTSTEFNEVTESVIQVEFTSPVESSRKLQEFTGDATGGQPSPVDVAPTPAAPPESDEAKKITETEQVSRDKTEGPEEKTPEVITGVVGTREAVGQKVTQVQPDLIPLQPVDQTKGRDEGDVQRTETNSQDIQNCDRVKDEPVAGTKPDETKTPVAAERPSIEKVPNQSAGVSDLLERQALPSNAPEPASVSTTEGKITLPTSEVTERKTRTKTPDKAPVPISKTIENVSVSTRIVTESRPLSPESTTGKTSVPPESTAKRTPISPDSTAGRTSVSTDSTARRTPVSPDHTAKRTPISPDSTAGKTPVSTDSTARRTPVSPDHTAKRTPISPESTAGKTPVSTDSMARRTPVSPDGTAKRTPISPESTAGKKSVSTDSTARRTPVSPDHTAKKTPISPDSTTGRTSVSTDTVAGKKVVSPDRATGKVPVSLHKSELEQLSEKTQAGQTERKTDKDKTHSAHEGSTVTVGRSASCNKGEQGAACDASKTKEMQSGPEAPPSPTARVKAAPGSPQSPTSRVRRLGIQAVTLSPKSARKQQQQQTFESQKQPSAGPRQAQQSKQQREDQGRRQPGRQQQPWRQQQQQQQQQQQKQAPWLQLKEEKAKQEPAKLAPWQRQLKQREQEKKEKQQKAPAASKPQQQAAPPLSKPQQQAAPPSSKPQHQGASPQGAPPQAASSRWTPEQRPSWFGQGSKSSSTAAAVVAPQSGKMGMPQGRVLDDLGGTRSRPFEHVRATGRSVMSPRPDESGDSDSDAESPPPLVSRVRRHDPRDAIRALQAMPAPDSPGETRRGDRRPQLIGEEDGAWPHSPSSTSSSSSSPISRRDHPRADVIYEGMIVAANSRNRGSYSVFDRNFYNDDVSASKTSSTLPRQAKPKLQSFGAPASRPVSWGGQELGRKPADRKASLASSADAGVPGVSGLRERFMGQSSDSASSSRTSLSSSTTSSVSSLRDRFMSPPPVEESKTRSRIRVVSPPPGSAPPGRSDSKNSLSELQGRFASPPPGGNERAPAPAPIKADPARVASIRNKFASPPPGAAPGSEDPPRIKPDPARTAKIKERLFSPPPSDLTPSTAAKLRDRIFPSSKKEKKANVPSTSPSSTSSKSSKSSKEPAATTTKSRDLPDVVSEEKPPDVEEDEFNEGIILPPLITQLKKILDQYPDDSQILKELIQNAEDAGGRTIRFLYDRHAYGANPRFLLHPGLARFQGPALYAYNDALFDEEDWKGIRMLSQSVKQNDPFKVGYFGLGFKSIFHITDLPSVLSGSRLGMIDPHQRCLPAATHSWNLAKKQDLLSTLPDQFAPFLRVFDCTREVFQEGFYNGTLFRFPLRTRASAISDSLYDKDKVHRLFRTFQSEAHLVLLFLRHLECIEVYERDELSVKPRLIFRAQLAAECLEDVRQKRSEFLNKAKAGNWMDKPITSTYPICVETVRTEGSKEVVTSYRWLLTNYYSGGQVSAIFRKLHRDTDLSYPPWVGVAMPLVAHQQQQGKEEEEGRGDETDEDLQVYDLDESDGHVFCFLPLPNEKQTPTGLPVHVNGFFALEQNRKYLKWPNSAQRQEDLMDKRLLWNQCLLKEALPRAYVELLTHAISIHRAGSNENIKVSTIYRAFPDFGKVDRKWEIMLPPIYAELFKHAVVHTSAHGGEWVMAREAIFNTLEESPASRAVILKVLAQNDVRVALVPAHVLYAIKTCCHINMAKITPNLVSSSYRTIQKKASLEPEEKLLLLRYLLSTKKFELIDGLLLLPLANGTFHIFFTNPRRADRAIFMATVDHPQVLLPGMDDHFFESDIDEDVLKTLAKAASKGYTQLKLLSKELVTELLPQCLPPEWSAGSPVTWSPGEPNQPPPGWLELLWIYLQKHFRRDLSMFENLSIMPVSRREGSTELVPLYAISGIIVQHLDGLSLGETLEGILTRLGVVVLTELPDYVRSHPKVLEYYVNSPSYIGVLRILQRITSHVGYPKFLKVFWEVTDDNDRRHLRELFSRMSPFHLQEDHRQLLCKLPLFETLNGSGNKPCHFVCQEEVQVGAPATPIPIHVSKPLLDISGTDSQNLAGLLGIRRMSVIELLRVLVFPDIERAFYQPADIETVMLYVLRHFYSYIEMDETFIDTLRALPFLPRKDMFVTPERLYDPAQQLLKTLFLGEENFPTGQYAEPSIIAILRQIGLRGPADVETEDLLETAYQIEDSLKTQDGEGEGEKTDSNALSVAVTKSGALLEYLSRHPNKLYESAASSKKELHQMLAEIHWVRPLRTKPTFYPHSLHWYQGEQSFSKPCQMRSLLYASTLGSVVPVIASSNLSDELSRLFGWDQTPTLAQMARHFANVVRSYDASEKAKYMELASRLYAQIEGHPAEDIQEAFKVTGLEDWIWHGEGFVKVERIVFTDPFMDLRPFVYSIPSEIGQFGELFAKCGVHNNCHLPDVLLMVKAKYDKIAKEGLLLSKAELNRDLHICVSILNEVKARVTPEQLPELQEQLMIPVHDERRKDQLRLAPLLDCTYCDQEWLRAGYDLRDLLDGTGTGSSGSNQGGGLFMQDQEDQMLFVHPNVPNATSEALGVPTLMSRMLDAEELDFSFGQTDSLTHRLNVLLQDYTDGFAVPKELVQNADDAGATTVSFLYDERHNEDAMTCLIDENMKPCQGPALWVHNDAVFTDEDFENITKLSGATKELQTDKIGRFGLGFNAVYNLTDVPSFISRHNIVIFDPHTTHLGKSIRNKSKPGIKIDMRKHKRKLRRLGNQFKPYNGLFGCDLRPDSLQESYDGTLFRFPLRTKKQAIESEICQKHYDKQEMTTLLQMLIHGAERLLLFTQNVIRISVHHLPPSSHEGSAPLEVFTVSKSPIQVVRELHFSAPLCHTTNKYAANIKAFIKQCSILKACTETMRRIREGKMRKDMPTPASTMILQLDRATTDHGARLLGLEAGKMAAPWLVCSSMGVGESMKMACMEENLLPTAGVAVPLEEDPKGQGPAAGGRVGARRYRPLPVTHPEDQTRPFGTVFTYLPLPIHTGLPVHINGAFAVTSNRRYLCERNEDDKFDVRAIWNESLLGDAVADTYIQLLDDLTKMADPTSYPFTQLWPNASTIETNSRMLLTSFYRLMAEDKASTPPLFSDGLSWVPLSKAVFLKTDFRQSQVGRVAMEVFTEVLKKDASSSTKVIDLPETALRGFHSAGSEAAIVSRSYDLLRFFREVLLPNIGSIAAERRDPLVLYALQQNDSAVNELLVKADCIPVSPDGETLRSPEELVDPSGDLASLYLPTDGRFPHGPYSTKEMHALLRPLGMASDDMSWSDVTERASSLHELDFLSAKRRVQCLVHFMEKKLEREAAMKVLLSGKSSSSSSTRSSPLASNANGADVADRYFGRLSTIPFLPVMQRPSQMVGMPWKGDDYAEDQFMKLTELYPSEMKPLVCCVEPLVDETVFPKTSEHVKHYFGYDLKVPSPELVLEQLDTIIASNLACSGQNNQEVQDEVQKIASAIYDHLQRLIEAPDTPKDTVSLVIDHVKDIPFIFCAGRFLKPRQVAFNFLHHCSPYIFGLPETLKRSFGGLFSRVGVRETFEVKDFVETLQLMHTNFEQQPLDKESLRLALRLVNLLNDSLSEAHLPLAEVVELYGCIYIPDSTCVLHDAAELCYNEPECQWLPPDEDIPLSHPLIPYAISKQLGVNTRREEVLRKHSRGIPFGQREKLTNRIKRILSSYPCDKEILKELLQNADDAGATQLHFVRDGRQHGTERVFDDSWKPLQGPALCVYNNSPFTELDLQGIQQLGEGSKSADPNKTGQYGVGFNCVYHLTDVPSFLTCSPHIGETLCIFDPHASYVPGATVEEPGRRYEDVQELRQIFTDVFPCYLEDRFDLRNGTMFRFPLRTPEMAECSDLSEHAVTVDKLDGLLNKFKRELFDCLLFVNSVQSISVSEVDKLTNRLSKTYTVTAEISDEDKQARKAFAEFLHSTGQRVAAGTLGVWEVPPREVSYVVRLTDNSGYWERWLVTQQVGFPDGTKISVALYDALKRGDLALLPRGGVAAPLENSDPTSPFRPMKAFCFLPLPLKTSLPVHINGHFALDHEARRNLWIDDENSPKTEWNMTMLKHIIARAYVVMMRHAPQYVKAPNPLNATFTGSNNTENGAPADVDDEDDEGELPNLEFYSALFPQFNTNEVYWRTLTQSVYQIIDSYQEPVLPVLKPRGHHGSGGVSLHDISADDSFTLHDDGSAPELEWVATNGDGRVRPYFDNLDSTFLDEADGTEGIMTPRNRMKSTPKRRSRRDHLRRVLLNSGYKLLHLPLDVYKAFREAKVLVECVSPASVIHFYRSYGTVNEACRIGMLPAAVSNTPFRSVRVLSTVIQYCIQDKQTFFTCLDGLPFLLTQDDQVRVFSGDESPFLTEHYSLLPECSFMFIHRHLVEKVFADVEPEDHHVFQRFDIPAMASLLINVLPDETYRNGRDQVLWQEREGCLPDAPWIRKLWQFIGSECARLTVDKEYNDEQMAEQIKLFLKPLRDWCILPAQVPALSRSAARTGSAPRDTPEGSSQEEGGEPKAEMYLVPIGMAETVIDFTQSSIMSYAVRDSLRKMRLPELNSQLLDGLTWSPMAKKKNSQTSHGNLNALMSHNAVRGPLYHHIGVNGTSGGGSTGNTAISDIVRLLVATLEKPHSVLKVLDYRTRRSPRLRCPTPDINLQLRYEDCNYILRYFSEFVGEWLQEQATIDSLRRLPFYLTVHGQLISIIDRIVYALPNDIPTADMQVWEKESGILFLRSNKHLVALHEKLGCLSLSVAEVYTRFIFKNFELLSLDARTVHLQFLKDGKLHQMEKADKDKLLVGLRHLEFLEDEKGKLHKASHFYDPYHSVFKVMLAEAPGAFPPAPFNEFKWLDFLRTIGLQHEISGEVFTTFAFQVSQEAMLRPSDKTFNKSRTLLSHLYSRPNLPSEGLLHKLADIKFLPPAKINPMLQKICPQYGYRLDGQLEYISFFDAIPETHEYLVWSSGHLLPNWANPFKLTAGDVSHSYPEGHHLQELENYRHEIASLLGIAAEPPVMKVVQHVRNICTSAHNANTPDELRAFMKADVMKVVYRYLQKKEAEIGPEVREALHDCPCIIVELGHNMMTPSQVVINMMEEDQIHPYLYKVPTELGEFKNLFLFLGASLNATVDQFAMVLQSIYQETKGARLHPNELRAAFKAVHGLFHTLERHPDDEIHTEKLYLPSMNATLVPSHDLVFNDDPSYTDRITDFDRPFIMDLSECGLSALDYDDLIKLLPKKLQPAMLTSIVKEILESSSRDTISSYGIAERLKHQLNSKAFSLGISRLVRHEHHRSGHKIHQDTLDAIQQHLQKIRVYGVEKVVTFLEYNRRRIGGSEIESECFVDKEECVLELPAHEQIWNVYVDNSTTMSEELLVCVAEVVNRIIGGLLRNSVHYLQPILSCPPHAVCKVLDRLKIRPDHSVDVKQPTLPTPGTFIPLEDHHLLKEDFEEFEIGEYVGYELEDSDDGDGPLYIYAVIMERLLSPQDDTSGGAGGTGDDQTSEGEGVSTFFAQAYKINVGDAHAPAVARVTDLYKFHRVEGFVSRNTSFMDDSFENILNEEQVGGKPPPSSTTGAAQAEPRSFSYDSRRRSKGENRYEPSQPTGSRFRPEQETGSRWEKGQRRGSAPASSSGYPHQGAGGRRGGGVDHENMNGFTEEPSWTWDHFPRRSSYTHKEQTYAGGPGESWGSTAHDGFSSQPGAGGSSNSSFSENTTYTRFYPGPAGARPSQERQGHATEGQSQEQDQSQGQDQPDAPKEPADAEDGTDGGPNKQEQAIMNEISDALEEAWQLSEKERRKVIKRLLLKWHPDKNLGDEQFATAITQFIHSEIERLEQGLPRRVNVDTSAFTPGNPFAGSASFQRNFEEAYKFFYEQMNQRAKKHKKQRERYKENFSREYTSTKTEYNFDVPPSFSSTNPQPSAARSFFRQAQEDLRAADNDFVGVRAGPAYEWVCFKAHQAAEKALKAAQFSVDAVSSFSHDLPTLASSTDDVRLRLYAMKLQNIVGDANKLYNPDPIDFVNIPHDRYTVDSARASVEIAENIIERVKEYMEIQD